MARPLAETVRLGPFPTLSLQAAHPVRVVKIVCGGPPGCARMHRPSLIRIPSEGLQLGTLSTPGPNCARRTPPIDSTACVLDQPMLLGKTLIDRRSLAAAVSARRFCGHSHRCRAMIHLIQKGSCSSAVLSTTGA